ncbi:ricin-type beta-trefoil lectin domain protein [Streptomyces sp. NPDC051133]|uniref:ricin-type beta-trefoil lectin domain protein n=1 Tax=Streptomyces sp. NPDC051133 TaxID=3155521 RepID=UPI00343A10BF
MNEAGLSDEQLSAELKKWTGASPALHPVGELLDRHWEAAFAYARLCTDGPRAAGMLTTAAFTRLFGESLRQAGPSAAWRPQVLVAVRRIAAEWDTDGRRELLHPELRSGTASGERVAARLLPPSGRRLLSRAFQRLPQASRAVLWHTEVEAEPLAVPAALLGLDGEDTQVELRRARERLREECLQAHRELAPEDECRRYLRMLDVTFRRGGVDLDPDLNRHLSGCTHCSRTADQLARFNEGLGLALAEGVLGWGARAYLESRARSAEEPPAPAPAPAAPPSGEPFTTPAATDAFDVPPVPTGSGGAEGPAVSWPRGPRVRSAEATAATAGFEGPSASTGSGGAEGPAVSWPRGPRVRSAEATAATAGFEGPSAPTGSGGAEGFPSSWPRRPRVRSADAAAAAVGFDGPSVPTAPAPQEGPAAPRARRARPRPSAPGESFSAAGSPVPGEPAAPRARGVRTRFTVAGNAFGAGGGPAPGESATPTRGQDPGPARPGSATSRRSALRAARRARRRNLALAAATVSGLVALPLVLWAVLGPGDAPATAGGGTPSRRPGEDTASPGASRAAANAAGQGTLHGRLHNLASDLCVDVVGKKAVKGAETELVTCSAAASQQWTYETDGLLRNADAPGLCLDSTLGYSVRLAPCTATGKAARAIRYDFTLQGALIPRWNQELALTPAATDGSGALVLKNRAPGDDQRWTVDTATPDLQMQNVNWGSDSGPSQAPGRRTPAPAGTTEAPQASRAPSPAPTPTAGPSAPATSPSATFDPCSAYPYYCDGGGGYGGGYGGGGHHHR